MLKYLGISPWTSYILDVHILSWRYHNDQIYTSSPDVFKHKFLISLDSYILVEYLIDTLSIRCLLKKNSPRFPPKPTLFIGLPISGNANFIILLAQNQILKKSPFSLTPYPINEKILLTLPSIYIENLSNFITSITTIFVHISIDSCLYFCNKFITTLPASTSLPYSLVLTQWSQWSFKNGSQDFWFWMFIEIWKQNHSQINNHKIKWKTEKS